MVLLTLKEKIETVSIPIIIGIILTLVGFFDNNTEKSKRKNYVVGGISLVIISFIIFLMLREKGGDVLTYYVFIGLPIIFITIGALRNEKDEKKRDTDLIIAGSVLGVVGLVCLYVFIKYEILNYY